MKKQVNKNFILSLTLVVMLLLVVFGGVELLKYFDWDGDDTVLYMLFGLGFFFWGLIWIFVIIIPAVLAALIFVFSLIARIIYKNTPGRRLAYKILMGFSFLGQIIVFFASLPILINGGWESVIGLFVSGYIGWAIFQGMRGTYTERLIINGGNDDNKVQGKEQTENIME